MASPGVQHSDCGLKAHQTEESCESSSETHSFNCKVDDVDVGCKQQNTPFKENVVGKGSPCTSPGVQHPDCELNKHQADPELHSVDREVDDVDVGSKQQNTPCNDPETLKNVIGKGSPCTSPGVQHPDCKLIIQQADPELHSLDREFGDLDIEVGHTDDASLV